MAFNQRMFGRLDVTPKPIKGEPIRVPCRKCKAIFILEKKHKEIRSQSMFFAKKKDGTLTPAIPKDLDFFRLCQACYDKLIKWFDQ